MPVRPRSLVPSLVAVLAVFPAEAADGPAKAAPPSLEERVRTLEEENRELRRALDEIRSALGAGKDAEARPVASVVRTEPSPPSGQARPTPAAAMAPAQKDEAVRWRDLMAGESRIQFYGFMRVDLITDSARPDNAQIPFFVLSRDSRASGSDVGSFTLHPRLSRFGLNFSGPAVETLGRARLAGQLEIDFQNGGRESRQVIRVRHANLKLTKGAFSVLAGQTWDVISPLLPTVNGDTLMWNAGNLGDRRPQITASWAPGAGAGQLSLTGGIALTGAIDALDLDSDGFRDGEESSRPNVQARLGYAHPSHVADQRWSFGVWGHRGWGRTIRPIAGRTRFASQSAGLDFAVPFASRLALRGEAWTGHNLSDVRGGIGQGINTATGGAIRSRGGWIEANFKAHPRVGISPGFTIDDPRDADLVSQGRVRNRAFYIAHRVQLRSFLVGVDYLRWLTDYKALQRGADNRVNLFFQYAF